MALSPKMLALIQKIEAVDAAHFAGLREDAKKETEARARLLEKKRANLCVARAVQARGRPCSSSHGGGNLRSTYEADTEDIEAPQCRPRGASPHPRLRSADRRAK